MAVSPRSPFVLVGGSPALDLVATFGRRHAEGLERLPDPAALGAWLVAAGLLVEPPEVTAEQLRRARVLREAIAALIGAGPGGPPVDPRAVRVVNESAAGPDRPPQLAAGPDGRLTAVVPADDVDATFAGIARDAVRLLSGPRAARIKQCAHPDCSVLFLDETQSGRRRWCAMQRCGNRVKTAGYRARRMSRPAH